MIFLLFAAIVFAFLLLGSLVFLICALAPPTRQYALSAALWCAVWGPCSVALMLLAGLGLVAKAFWTNIGDMQSFHAPRLLAAFGWGYMVMGVFITAVAATGIAWLHQKLAQRFTFSLFRLYAAAVSAGIGSVFGWCLGGWIMWKEVAHYGLFCWCVGMLILVVAFAAAAYKGARRLRGDAPKNLTWITTDEYLGTDRP